MHTVARDPCAPLRHVQTNPPGAGLVTHRRTVQREVVKHKVHNDLRTTKLDKDSWASASLVNTRYQFMLQLGGMLPQLTLGPILYSWIDWSNVSECSRKQQHQSGRNSGRNDWPFFLAHTQKKKAVWLYTQGQHVITR